MLKRSLHEPVIEGVQLPGFPPAQLQENFVGASGERALDQANSFYLLLRSKMAAHATPLATGDRVLDFGCGWARILRFFIRDVAVTDLFGIDAMPAAVSLCHEYRAPGNVLLVADLPPTALRHGAFKLIYAYSVFSHLPESTGRCWIEELAALLAPGGLLVITTRNRWFLDHFESLRSKSPDELSYAERTVLSSLGDLDAIRARYEAGEHVFVPMVEVTEGLSEARYGEAFVPEHHAREAWGRWLEVVSFEEMPAGLDQAVIVMRRR
jgi:SAM-dependent methyltransferase